MIGWRRIAALAVAFGMLPPALASDIDSALVDNASALIAVQLSSEVGKGLSAEFVRKGMTEVEADALVFRILDGAARCTVRRLQDHELPQVASFVELLTRNEKMAGVTGALNDMYDAEELDEMQSQIAMATRDCLALSMRVLQQAPKRPVASTWPEPASSSAAS